MQQIIGLRRIVVGLTVLAAAAFGSATAQADPVTLANGESITYTYLASVGGNSATAQVTYNQGAGTLTVVLTNTSSNTLSKLQAFGIDIVNAGVTGTLTPSPTGNAVANFIDGGGGLPGYDVGANSDPSNDGGVLNENESITLVFTLTSAPASLILGDTQVHLTALNVQDLSDKPFGTPSAIPEPASMLLLGTGLAGVAAGLRRRRGAAK